MNFRDAGRNKERGATLVEAAVVYLLLFLSLFAIIEFGMAFKDWLSVSHGSREGARAGATFGQDPASDILILREVEGVMSPIGFPSGSEVRIYNASPGGVWAGTGTDYQYAPGTGCASSVSPALPGCCDWSPCPEPGRTTFASPVWPTNQRIVEAPHTDRIGVEVTYFHNWLTGFFNDGQPSDFTTATEFQLEPEVFGTDS
ncbi:MAG TPA: TadE/TadG family type IV pilus assembly protein [Acidimicrobiia bacterium]|nr:TadE/TadG family type IV pilus assembly protein [Acidimicrobiia bacterium]